MDRELSRRDFFRNTGVAGIGLSVLRDWNVPQRMFNGSSTLHRKQSKPETAFYKR
jgi:hypothetical protein